MAPELGKRDIYKHFNDCLYDVLCNRQRLDAPRKVILQKYGKSDDPAVPQSRRAKSLTVGTALMLGVGASVLVLHPAVDLAVGSILPEDPAYPALMAKAAVFAIAVGVATFAATLFAVKVVGRRLKRR